MTAGIAVSGFHPLMAAGSEIRESKNPGRKIHVFSKHLQWLGYQEMAETVRQIGFDGIDLTVRPNGHVLPVNVKEDLAKAIKAIRSCGLLADRITTAITDADDPLTIQVLTVAAELGIENYRLGWLSYDESKSIKENLHFFNLKLQKLAAVNRKLGIKGAYQNHAGEGVGGAVWDMGLLLDAIDPEYLGIRYDIRHATVSGGLSWTVGLEYLADKINSLDLKDFVWKEKENKWQPVNVPLGKGMVDFDRFLEILKQENINGDFTMHFEYELGGADTGAFKLTVPPETVISAMKRDLAVFKAWM